MSSVPTSLKPAPVPEGKLGMSSPADDKDPSPYGPQGEGEIGPPTAPPRHRWNPEDRSLTSWTEYLSPEFLLEESKAADLDRNIEANLADNIATISIRVE